MSIVEHFACKEPEMSLRSQLTRNTFKGRESEDPEQPDLTEIREMIMDSGVKSLQSLHIFL